MILKLINNENTYEFNVTDLNEGVKLYYHFEIPTVDIPDGKYNMQLLDGETVIYEDIVCIGDFKGATIQYKRGENIYINAPLLAKLEDVTVEITTTETVVYPSDEYDAIASVQIDATPVYENGYNTGNADGYNQGVEVGKEEQKNLLESITITENGTYTKEDGYNEIVVDVPDLNGDYNSGFADGFNQGKTEGIETLPILEITSNGTYNTPSKGVNVNVYAKIDVVDKQIKFGHSDFADFPEYYFFSGRTSGNYLFNYCINLKNFRENIFSDVAFIGLAHMFDNCRDIEVIPEMNTSLVENFSYAFYSCQKIKTIPQIYTSNGTNFSNMFYDCPQLETIPELDLSRGTSFNAMFQGTTNLKSLPTLNTINGTNFTSMFQNTGLSEIPEIDTTNATTLNNFIYTTKNSIVKVPALNASNLTTSYGSTNFAGSSNNTALTDFGGLIGLKLSVTSNGFEKLPNLSYESCINVLNGLYDFVGNGETPTSSQGKLKVHQNFLDLVGNEISIGVQKGWVISAS